MPVVTPSIKWNSVKRYGSDIILYGDTFDEAYEFALQKSQQEDLTFVHPFDNIDIIAGQGTIGSEIINQFDSNKKVFYTIKKKVSPKQGRVVLFDGRHFHLSLIHI